MIVAWLLPPRDGPNGLYVAPEASQRQRLGDPHLRPYKTADGKTCRNLKQVATKAGQTREQDVTACRSPAGSWEIPT